MGTSQVDASAWAWDITVERIGRVGEDGHAERARLAIFTGRRESL